MKMTVTIFSLICCIAVVYIFLQPQQSDGSHGPATALDGVIYTDLVGRKVSVVRDVKRIVLPRSKDIYLLASLLGEELPQKLIAWGPDLEKDDSEVYKELVSRFPQLVRIPVTGSVYNDALDPEQIIQLKPDLVILDKFMLDRGYKYTERLEAAKLPVVYLDGSNDPFMGPQKGLALTGEILGKKERAERIVEYVQDQLDLVLSRIKANKSPPPSIYLEQGYLGPQMYADTYGSLGDQGKYTSWGTILYALKVKNIADGRVARQAPISPEFVLSSNPDVIVITGQNWSNPGCMRLGYNIKREESVRLLCAFLKRPGCAELAAVKSKRVYSVFHNTCAITIFSGIQYLAKACYPELFVDTYPERSLRVFHERFMPIDYSGTWTCRVE